LGPHAFRAECRRLLSNFAEFGTAVARLFVPSEFRLEWWFPWPSVSHNSVMEHHAPNGSWRIIPQPPTVDFLNTSVCSIFPKLPIGAFYPASQRCYLDPVPFVPTSPTRQARSRQSPENAPLRG
jgi:hypothetical protein